MKRILLFAFVVLATTHLSAQDLWAFQYGVKGGLSHLALDYSDYPDYSDRSTSDFGFYVGFTSEYEMSEKFSVQPELLYASVKDVHSVYIPVMANYHPIEGLRIQAGPQIHFLIKNEIGLDLELGFGAAYDIYKNFFIDARYAFGQRDWYGLDITLETFQFGIGYRIDN